MLNRCAISLFRLLLSSGSYAFSRAIAPFSRKYRLTRDGVSCNIIGIAEAVGENPEKVHQPPATPTPSQRNGAMTIVTSYDWESDTFTQHTDDLASHQVWREAVEDVADKARETLPDCAGRVDAAVKIVLQ